MSAIEQRLKEIGESIGEIAPSFDRESAKSIAQSRKDVPYLLALVNHYRRYLKEIGRPTLGGKLQQYAAREALNFNPEKP